MKSELLGLSALLAALSVEGAPLKREQLDAMLDELAHSPKPKPIFAPTAMCYVICPPMHPVHEVWTCPKCGESTVYPSEDILRLHRHLAKEAESLRSFGLDIAFEKVELCAACAKLNLPTRPRRGEW